MSYEANKAWRHRHPDRRHAQKIGYRSRTGSFTGPNLGTSWTQEEDRQVREQALPDRELAASLGRSVQAVQVRRWRLRQRQELAS